MILENSEIVSINAVKKAIGFEKFINFLKYSEKPRVLIPIY
jgi:hypothetical protein